MAPHTCHFCDNLVIRPIQTAQTGSLAQFLFNCTLQDLQSSLAIDCDFAKFVLKALHQGFDRQSAESKQAPLATGELVLFIKFFRLSNSHEIEGVHSIGLLDRREEENKEFCSNRSSSPGIDYLVMYATDGEFFISALTRLHFGLTISR